nr:MAG TPA: hypothetical protein [Bacteriophage sp.]
MFCLINNRTPADFSTIFVKSVGKKLSTESPMLDLKNFP